jgi:hypothetical protein
VESDHIEFALVPPFGRLPTCTLRRTKYPWYSSHSATSCSRKFMPPYLRTIVAVTVPDRDGRDPGSTIVSDSASVPACGLTVAVPLYRPFKFTARHWLSVICER